MVKALSNKGIVPLNVLNIDTIIAKLFKEEKLTKDVESIKRFLNPIRYNQKVNLKKYKKNFLANLKVQDFVSKAYEREKELHYTIVTKIQITNLRLGNILLKEYTIKKFLVQRKITQELVLKNYEKENVFWENTKERVWHKFSSDSFHQENRITKKVM